MLDLKQRKTTEFDQIIAAARKKRAALVPAAKTVLSVLFSRHWDCPSSFVQALVLLQIGDSRSADKHMCILLSTSKNPKPNPKPRLSLVGPRGPPMPMPASAWRPAVFSFYSLQPQSEGRRRKIKLKATKIVD
jgi:hypothetical protein